MNELSIFRELDLTIFSETAKSYFDITSMDKYFTSLVSF
jgi:hypothetical protein